MKYYKFDLLENESQWSQNDAEYFKVFESIKELLPKDFLDIYLSEHGFHDIKINKILLSDSAELTVELKKRDNGFIKVTYVGAEDFKLLNIDNICKERQTGNLLEWAYDEFSVSGERLVHSILTSCGLEFELSFRTVNAVYSTEELKSEGTQILI